MDQSKIDTLTSVISNNIKSPGAKTLALKIVVELIDWLNNTTNHNKELMAWKTNNKISDIECELQKYIHLLVFHGYSQKNILTIRPECTLFAAKNVQHIPKGITIDNINSALMVFELDHERQPNDYIELKNYIDEIKG